MVSLQTWYIRIASGNIQWVLRYEVWELGKNIVEHVLNHLETSPNTHNLS